MKGQKRDTMFARVDEWKKSGMSMREFSSRIGLSKVSTPLTPYFSIA